MSNTVKKKFNIGRRVYFVDRSAKPYPVLREGAIRSFYVSDSKFYYTIAINKSVNKHIVSEEGIMSCIPECDISFSKAEVYEKVIESLKGQIGELFNVVLRLGSLLAEEKGETTGERKA